MKADVDRLMMERGLDALVVTGPASNNPTMFYLANGVKVTEATILLKKRGGPPILIVNPMEREEAAKSGLHIIPQNQYEPLRLLSEEHGDALRARVRLLEAIFADLALRGRVAVYGREEQGKALALAEAFNARQNGATLVGEFADSVFDAAWLTKDSDEIARIRAAGVKTVNVVTKTAEFLQSHRVKNGALVRPDGTTLTVGDVKRQIGRMMADEDLLDDPESVIFAIGHDAGVPHSRGEDLDLVELGKTVVYDIFPRDSRSGYCYDFTRTWCLGFAPPEVERCYRDVLHAFESTLAETRASDPCRAAQQRANELFEARGHPTLRSDPKTGRGYVHSLGHGIGLSVHELPSLSDYEGNAACFEPGCVVTVEPGLYYPDDGFGIRIEDTLWVNPSTGRLEPLVEFPKELVLPISQ